MPALLVVLAVLVVGGLGVVVATSGGDDGAPEPSDESAEGSEEDDAGGGGGGSSSDPQAWTAPAIEGDSDLGEVIRTLTSGDALVIVNQRSVTSIDRRTGEQNWHLHMEQFDDSAGQGETWVLCGASTTASEDGKLAVTAGFDNSPTGSGDTTVYAPTCGLVFIVDLRIGAFAGDAQVAYEGGGSQNPGLDSGMPVEIVGDTVIVTWYATIFGLNLSDLSEQWRWIAGVDHGMPQFDCVVDDMALGDDGQLVVMSGCISEVGDKTYLVDELSTAGQPGRSHEITAAEAGVPEISSLALVSASPVVIHVRSGGTDATLVHALVTLDDSWGVLSSIHDERTAESAERGLVVNAVGFFSTRTGAWREPNRSLVAGTTLVSFTAPNQGHNQLVAVDLGTGNDLWAVDAPSGYAFWQVLAIEGEIAYALAMENDGPHHTIVTVDLASGEIRDDTATTAVGRPDDPENPPAQPADIGFLYADGRAYGVDFGRAGEPGLTWMAYSVG